MKAGFFQHRLNFKQVLIGFFIGLVNFGFFNIEVFKNFYARSSQTEISALISQGLFLILAGLGFRLLKPNQRTVFFVFAYLGYLLFGFLCNSYMSLNLNLSNTLIALIFTWVFANFFDLSALENNFYYEGINEELLAKADRMTQEKDNFEHQVEISKIKEELTTSQNQIEQYKLELESLQSTLNEKENMLANSNIDNESVVNNYENQISLLKAELAELNNDSEQHQNQLNTELEAKKNNSLEDLEKHLENFSQLFQTDNIKLAQEISQELESLAQENENAKASLEKFNAMLENLDTALFVLTPAKFADKRGLVDLLDIYSAKLFNNSNGKLKIGFESSVDNLNLDPKQSLQIFRIVQYILEILKSKHFNNEEQAEDLIVNLILSINENNNLEIQIYYHDLEIASQEDFLLQEINKRLEIFQNIEANFDSDSEEDFGNKLTKLEIKPDYVN